MLLSTQNLPPSPCDHDLGRRKNLFPPTAEKCGGNYDLLYQNSVIKYENDFEH